MRMCIPWRRFVSTYRIGIENRSIAVEKDEGGTGTDLDRRMLGTPLALTTGSHRVMGVRFVSTKETARFHVEEID
jgi:hypothetical protein